VNIDLISDREWSSVIDGTRNVQFDFLALQLFLVNLRNRLQAKEICTQDCIRELTRLGGFEGVERRKCLRINARVF
jgi:hypothetical protein